MQLIGKVFGKDEPKALVMSDVTFCGDSRLDAKRAMLRYWSRNQPQLGMSFDEFNSRCTMLADNRTIVFKGPN